MKTRPFVRLRALALALGAAAVLAAPWARAAEPPAARGLPPGVEAALGHAGLPREAMVAWVEEVGRRRVRAPRGRASARSIRRR
jgi:hypothetical protein